MNIRLSDIEDPAAVRGFLPESVLELVDAVGLKAALKLVELRGGTRISIAGKATEAHWLAEHIGMDSLEKLMQYYSGEGIDLPRCREVLLVMREQAILSEERAGASVAKLALKHGYTERGMRKLLRRARRRRVSLESGRAQS